MNVLSLFDGMSCGQIALNRAGVQVDNYYSSEIDKYAISIAQKNYPSTVQLGDVCSLISTPEPIDLLIGGSPCQGFSFAGKQLNFDDPRSALFFEFVRVNKELKPKYFLLENVRMKQEYQDIISSYLGVKPVIINSALVSAQKRVRYYWTNIEGVEQPKDKGIFLKDVLEPDTVEPMLSNIYGGFKETKPRKHYGKSVTIRANSGGGAIPSISLKFVGGLESGRRLHDGKSLSRNYREGSRVYSPAGKASTLTAQSKGGKGGYSGLYGDTIKDYRQLTPIECERLQTVPDNYTEGVSNSQRYKMLGNGWTVDVIAHILKGINIV